MNGFFNVLKSTSMTSSDAVVILRGILRRQTGDKHKVGHLGTLDPGGAGVLPIAVGSAVKLFDYMLAKTKVYRTCFVFGETTDTLDSYGHVTERGDLVTDKAKVLEACAKLVGTYDQMPPAYSAKSVDGVRAYDLARKGVEVDLKPREVNIESIELVEQEDNAFTFDVTCSADTYIRSLARDMAGLMGTVGYMRYIIRLRSGEFDLEHAVTLKEIEKDLSAGFVPLEQYAEGLPSVLIPEEDRRLIDNGVVYPLKGQENALLNVVVGDTPYAVGTVKEGRLKVICRL
ncbi:MAG: tRNA pseudouridine(55) synthase TruB [Clostridia bacterium]|nr:tRNA pseudouridine(55) synthase TruB [Clostridia bacterium]